MEVLSSAVLAARHHHCCRGRGRRCQRCPKQRAGQIKSERREKQRGTPQRAVRGNTDLCSEEAAVHPVQQCSVCVCVGVVCALLWFFGSCVWWKIDLTSCSGHVRFQGLS